MRIMLSEFAIIDKIDKSFGLFCTGFLWHTVTGTYDILISTCLQTTFFPHLFVCEI